MALRGLQRFVQYEDTPDFVFLLRNFANGAAPSVATVIDSGL